MELSMHTVPGVRKSLNAHSKDDRGAFRMPPSTALPSSGGTVLGKSTRCLRLKSMPALDLDGAECSFTCAGKNVDPAAGDLLRCP
jgi:hypothetical protein